MKEEIQKIRRDLEDLNKITEEIIDFLNALQKVNKSAKKMWIGDVKEFYYHLFSAWEMLKPLNKSRIRNIQASKNFLFIARNDFSRVMSILKIFKTDEKNRLISQVGYSFETCWVPMWIIIKREEDFNFTANHDTIIHKISDLRYQLSCSICGKNAVEFKIGYGKFDENKSLIYRGITHESSLDIDLADTAFTLLKEGDLGSIHKFLKNHHNYEGLDAYCPECDKIYCWEHYDAHEAYDEGFYDFTYGICPKGHKRMIDD
jgi:hypothetical protein